jgi:hypothetical protein
MDRASGLAHPRAQAHSLVRQPALWAGALCLAAVGLAVGATRAASDAALSPISPPGHWHAALAIGVIGSFAAYAAGLVLLARRPAEPGPVLGLVVAIQLVPLAAPLLLSRDPLVYEAWGRISQPFVKHGAWPPVETYGPLWALLSEPLAVVDGHGVYAFRILAAGCVLGIVALVWRLATRKVLAAAFVGWNPFVALHFAGGAHNDALMMLLVLGAMALAVAGLPQLGGASWATAVAIKWTAAWFFVLWAIQRFRRREPLGLAGLAIAGAVMLALAFGSFGTAWPHAFSSLSSEMKIDHPSLGSLGYLEDAGLSRHPALALAFLLELGASAFFALQAWRGRLHLGLAAGVLVILSTRLDPWYALWPISLAAADDEDRWGRLLAVVLSGLLLTDVFSHVIEA